MYGRLYKLFNPIVTRRAKGDPQELRNVAPGQWQAEHFAEILDLPRDVRPVCTIPIGWAKGRYGPTQRTPIGEVVHLDHYDNQPFRDPVG